MKNDTVCSMYKREHRHKHFGVGSLWLPRDELFQFVEGQQPLFPPPQKMVPLLLFFVLYFFLKFSMLKVQNNDGNESSN